jgi:TonB family protein
MHRLPVEYPAAARAAGVQGAVVVELALDKQGSVADAHVLSGPEDLRRAVLTSVLGWHYAADTVLPGRVQATIAFRLPAQPAAAAPAAAPVKVVKTAPRQFRGALLKIDVEGLAEATRGDLLNALPVRVGEDLSEETLKGVLAAVKAFDPHLAVQAVGGEKGYALRITLAAAMPEGRIAISDSVPARNMKIVRMVRPAYPPEAKQQGIQGTVKLRATVDREGKVANLEVLSGEPLLANAALEAVKQWEYVPAMLDGQLAAVKVDVDVNFTLAR